MVTVLRYSVMDVVKDLYGQLDVIDLANGLSSGSYNLHNVINNTYLSKVFHIHNAIILHSDNKQDVI